MSSVSNIKSINNFDLTKIDGLPASLTSAQKEQILLGALEDPDPDQRFAAIKRIEENEIPFSLKIQEKILEILPKEKDTDVIYEIIRLCIELDIKEAASLISNYLNHQKLWLITVEALEKLQGSAAVPLLQKAFKNNPSKIIAETLLRLGDPYPYYQNFFKKDLEIFGDQDYYIEYKCPLWLPQFQIGFGFIAPESNLNKGMDPEMPQIAPIRSFGAECPTEKKPTFASEEKPKISTNIYLLLNAFDKNNDKRSGVHFLLTLANNSHGGFSKEILTPHLKKFINEETFPILLEEIKSNPKSYATELIIDYWLQLVESEELNQLKLSEKSKKETLETLHNLLKDEYFSFKRSTILMLLSYLGDESIVPYLLESIKKNFYCSAEILALSKLKPTDAEPIFIEILKNKNYSDEAQIYAAIALAKNGKRNGLDLLLNTFDDLVKSFGGPSEYKTKLLSRLHNSIKNIINSQDSSEIIKRFVKSPYPPAIMAGLEFLSIIKDPQNIPEILTFLDTEKFEIETVILQLFNNIGKPVIKRVELDPELVKLEIKFKALLTLATIRDPFDKESLEIIEKEVNFWKEFFPSEKKQSKTSLINPTPSNNKISFSSLFPPDHITYFTYTYGPLYLLVREYLPKLEDYIEECELAIWEKSSAKPKLQLNLKSYF